MLKLRGTTSNIDARFRVFLTNLGRQNRRMILHRSEVVQLATFLEPQNA